MNTNFSGPMWLVAAVLGDGSFEPPPKAGCTEQLVFCGMFIHLRGEKISVTKKKTEKEEDLLIKRVFVWDFSES